MKNINNIKAILLLSVAVLFISCERLVEERNFQDDPNTVGSVPTVNLVSQVELVATYLNESDASRYAGIMSNIINGDANQWTGFENYSFTPGDFDALWSNLYSQGIDISRKGRDQAIAEGNDDAIAAFNLLEAYILGELALSFGNVPDSEAIEPGNNSPAYDPQASVLATVHGYLDDIIANSPNSTFYVTDANGSTRSTSTLGQLAHSFKARYFLAAGNYGAALTEAQQGIASNGAGLVSIHANTSGAQNMWYNFTRLARPGDTSPTGSYLQELVDPNGSVNRKLVTPGEAARYDFYYDSSDDDYNNNEDGIFAADASLPIISWYENQLILAEAAFRTGNQNLAQTALNAVRAELDTQYGGGFPPSTATGNMLLLHILEEKYITLYPSIQTWHDLTRTDNALGITLKTGNQLPQRFLYSQDELNTNENVPSPLPGLFTPTPINQ